MDKDEHPIDALQLVNSMISGASGRKCVKPTQLERIEVLLPPLPVQPKGGSST